MKLKIILFILIPLIVFLGWRFIRPMNIFVISPAFEYPITTQDAPAMFVTLSAEECKSCHRAFYDEWKTTIHSQAWTDPYFRVDWKFDGSPQNCKNCHIPLDRQQEHLVLGFKDDEKWDPILKPNPDFDAKLQHEGVTCNVCHLKDGFIIGVRGNTAAPHPVKKIDNANRVCIRCHVVSGERWDTFFRFPPCGTVAEIQSSRGEPVRADSGEMTFEDIASLGCVDCHMPLVERPVVTGGEVRKTRRHTWRGGHDPDMVKQALTVDLSPQDKNKYTLSLTNTGTAHYAPTGTPDRHFTVTLRLLDANKKVLEEQQHVLKRTVMWRPFIVDLWDTRLPPNQTREYSINLEPQARYVEALVTYHLLDEARRKRIGYENQEPIYYSVYQHIIELPF